MDGRAREYERYFWISFFLTLISNQIPFQGARLLIRGRVHYSLALPVDALVPFLPWTVCIYWGALLYWFFLYRRVARLPRPEADRFFCANLLGKAICFLFFVFFPTTLVRPELKGTSLWDFFMRLTYRVDKADNLFPSLHCMIAWLCWVGVRGKRQVSPLWRVSALLMAAAVCLSTLTVRQHVLLDVFGGILLAELCYALAALPSLRALYAALADRLCLWLASVQNRKEEHGG